MPSDRKWYRNVAVAYVLEKRLAKMDPKYPRRPDPDPGQCTIPD